MKNKAQNFLVMAFIASFFVMSCASTKLTSVWNDKGYNGGTLNKIMIVGVSEKISNRRIFEDELAEQLKSRGTDAISSAAVTPADQELNVELIRAAAKKQKVDAVLVTHLEGVKEESVYYAPAANPNSYQNRFDYYYLRVQQRAASGGYTAKYQKVLLESNLYETATEKLLWTAASETFDPKSVNELVKSLSELILNSMKDSGLIK